MVFFGGGRSRNFRKISSCQWAIMANAVRRCHASYSRGNTRLTLFQSISSWTWSRVQTYINKVVFRGGGAVMKASEAVCVLGNVVSRCLAPLQAGVLPFHERKLDHLLVTKCTRVPKLVPESQGRTRRANQEKQKTTTTRPGTWEGDDRPGSLMRSFLAAKAVSARILATAFASRKVSSSLSSGTCSRARSHVPQERL